MKKTLTKTEQKTNPSNKSTESGGKAEEVASDVLRASKTAGEKR